MNSGLDREISIEAIKEAKERFGSNRRAGQHLGIDEATVRRRILKDEAAKRQAAVDQARVDVREDQIFVISDAKPDITLGDIEGLLKNRGINPDDWVVVSTTINSWEALASGGGPEGEPKVVVLHQLKVFLRRKIDVQLVSPAVHVPGLGEARRAARSSSKGNPKNSQHLELRVTEPDLIVVEGDHQAPYYDQALHRASLKFLSENQPAEHIFLGDLLDFPTISKYADHPAAMAAVQECLDAGYKILREKAEASPDSKRIKLLGNHDWRLEAELLMRAERMHGITPAGEEIPAMSLQRLLHLDRLKIALVEHPLGWEHAEVEIVEGRDGLVVKHGIVVGQNVGRKTLDKIGRSVIVGHAHMKESIFRRDPFTGSIKQAVVAGVMCRIDEVFPHFTKGPADWHPGFVVVSRWKDGRFHVEHANWSGGCLTWRDKRWEV